MMIHRLSMLPVVGNSRSNGGVLNKFERVSKWLLRAVGVLLLALGVNSGVMALEVPELALDKRRHGPLFEGLAEPPPGLDGMSGGKALTGEPLAPFVFPGVTRITDTAFESNEDHLIGATPATINVREGSAAHFSGQIGAMPGSPNGLIKVGGGELVLSGANTYTGSTLLLQGGLQARSNTAWSWHSLHAAVGTRLEYAPGVEMSTALVVTTMEAQDWAPPGSYDAVTAPEHADSLRWVVSGGEAVHAGLLQGSAPFVKQGAGRLNISGDAMPYTGDVLVESGALAINDVFSGSIQVGKGARLEGSGWVASANIRSGGTLAPGNSIGTLSVSSDLRFEPGSVLEVEVDPDGAGDSVLVGGKAVLAGDVVALARAGVWRPSTSYALLSAGNGLEGSFDSVSVPADFAFLEPALSYDANTVTLTLVRNEKPLDDVAETPDEEKVADALDDDAAPAPPGLRDEVLMLDRATARGAFQQLAGSWSASLLSSMSEDSRFVRQAALAHSHVRGFWSRAFYSRADRAEADGVPGDTRSLHGLVLGANRRMGEAWQAGAFFGVQHASLRRAGIGAHGSGQSGYGGQASAALQSTHLGVMATGQWQPLSLAAGVVHSWHAIKGTRRVAFGSLDDSLSSRYRAHGIQVFVDAAWPVWRHNVHPPPGGIGDGLVLDQGGPRGRPGSFRLEPFVRMAYVRVSATGFDERGGPAALSVQPARQAVLFSSLGLRAEHTLQTDVGEARIQGQLAWRYAGGARQPLVSQTFRDGAGQHAFALHGLPIARSAWSLGLSVTGQLSRHASLSLAYAGQLAKGSRDHGVQMSVSWVF